MTLQLKHIKENEAKMHDQLYNNILVLTYIYPTTKDFDSVFKRNMFVKNNKAAFHQIVYYLLNVLNPELTKEKITEWPLYDVKLEAKFRTEVLAYINELNVIYKDANIPGIMASHLISPGGYKFVKFVLKLSHLVLLEHLRKNKRIEVELLAPMKPCKGDLSKVNAVQNSFRQKTANVEMKTRKHYEKFYKDYENAVQSARIIVSEQTQINKDLQNIRKAYQIKKDALSEKDYESLQKCIYEKCDKLKTEMVFIANMEDLCKRGDELLTDLLNGSFVLEYNSNQLIIPKSVQNLIRTDSNNLDLHQLFNGFNTVLEDAAFEMPDFTTNQLNDMMNMITEMNDKYSELYKRLTEHKNKLSDTLACLRPEMNGVQLHNRKTPIIHLQLHASDENLAVPLDFSEN